MRKFLVNAICDQNVLWEIMQFLEEKRCTGILARPAPGGLNGADKQSPIGRDLALELLSKKPMTPKMLQQSLHKGGFSGHVYGILHFLKRKKLIKRNAKGEYSITKKGV